MALMSATVLPMSACQSGDVLFLGRQELMKRGIQETDGNRVALHSLVHGLRSRSADRAGSWPERLRAVPRYPKQSSPALRRCAQDQRTCAPCGTGRCPCAPSSTGLFGVAGVSALVRTCSLRYLSARAMMRPKIPRDGGVHGGDDSVVNIAGGTVDGDIQSPSWKVLPPRVNCLVFLIHVDDLTAAGDAAGAHATRDDGSVGRHAAADGQDALGETVMP